MAKIEDSIKVNKTFEVVSKIDIVNVEIESANYAANLESALIEIGNLATQIRQAFYNSTIEIGKMATQITDEIRKANQGFINQAVQSALSVANALKGIEENPDSLMNWCEYGEALKNFFWVYPYKLESYEMKQMLLNIKDEISFDRQMLAYFNQPLITELCEDIKLRLKGARRRLFAEIVYAYNNKQYGIANMSLISIIDDLLSYFLADKGKAPKDNLLDPIINDLNNGENYWIIINAMMVNNCINTLYENKDFNHSIKIDTAKIVRRHCSAHCKHISFKKKDTILLFNLIYSILIMEGELPQYRSSLKYKNKKFILLSLKERKAYIREIKNNKDKEKLLPLKYD